MRGSSFSSPWPDPNSPVLAKIDFGVPLVELFKWLDVRDNLLGENYKKQDIAKALALALSCKHPDGMWLTSIFGGKEILTKEEARKVFLLHQDDARALCFAWHFTNDREGDLSLLRRAADMGYAFACFKLFKNTDVERLQLALQHTGDERLLHQAAAKHEREGLFTFGRILYFGIVDVQSLSLAKENILIAAELGYLDGATLYGSFLEDSDPIRWLWWSRAALHGEPSVFLNFFSDQVRRFFKGEGSATAVFLIGHALKGNIDVKKKEVFGSSYAFNVFDSLVGPAKSAVSFYEAQINAARLAVDTWTLIATRLHLIKDMRILIGKMIWEGRFEANYHDLHFLQEHSKKMKY